MKQAATSEQSSRPRLDAARAQMEQIERSDQATALLSKLEAWRSEHFAVLGKLKMGASRLEEGVRNYIQLEQDPMPGSRCHCSGERSHCGERS